MRFVRLDVYEVRIPFRFAFTHAAAERRAAHSLLLALHTDAGQCGLGEIVPRGYLTGETIETAWDDLRRRWWPAIKALTLADPEPPWGALRPVYLNADAQRRTASYAGVDIAVFDAWARWREVSLGRLFGASPPAPATATLGLGRVPPLATRWLTWRGFREFKAKIASPDDLGRIRALRRLLRPPCDLRVDANGSFSPDQAVGVARVLTQIGISSFEQPVPAADVDGMAKVQREGRLPVVADESLCTLADARRLLQANAAAIWNVRLAKVGGFSGARELIHLAGGRGIQVQMGVLVGETSVLAAAARACLAAARWRHVEHGFPRLLLRHDPVAGLAALDGASVPPLGGGPGLGIRLSRGRLARLAVRQASLD